MRKGMPIAVLLVSASAALAQDGASPLPEQTDDPADAKTDAEAAIFERQLVMTQLEEDTKTLGQILAGVVTKEKLAETTRAIAKGAKEAEMSFRSKVPGGRTKPAAWEGTDFFERMSSFVSKTEALAAMAETGNFFAVTEMAVTALPCKQCHDSYRERKR